MNHKQRNKRLEQQKRRRVNNKGVPFEKLLYDMIDGNKTHYPYAYCKYHKGWMTKSLVVIHKCEERKCVQFEVKESEGGK